MSDVTLSVMSEHGCERLSHDQPNRLFPDRELFGLTSGGTSWENAEQFAQGSAVADSLAQAAARFRKVKPNKARRGRRNRTQTGMMCRFAARREALSA